MKLKESTAWKCRWFDVLAAWCDDPRIQDIGDLDVLADFSENDYSGRVSVAFISRDEECCYIEYYYGSCSSCDAWEELGDEVARLEILRTMVVLPPAEFVKFAAEHWLLKTALDEMVSRLFNPS